MGKNEYVITPRHTRGGPAPSAPRKLPKQADPASPRDCAMADLLFEYLQRGLTAKQMAKQTKEPLAWVNALLRLGRQRAANGDTNG